MARRTQISSLTSSGRVTFLARPSNKKVSFKTRSGRKITFLLKTKKEPIQLIRAKRRRLLQIAYEIQALSEELRSDFSG